VTSFPQLDVVSQVSSDTINYLNEEFVEWNHRVEAGRAKLADFQRWRVENWSTYYDVSLPSFVFLNVVHFLSNMSEHPPVQQTNSRFETVYDDLWFRITI
jgi:hypothetical protein